VGTLFRTLLDPRYTGGVVVDGFPRTKPQAECVKLLATRLAEFNRAAGLPAPVFRVVILSVTENESVARQMKRGREAMAHNEEVKRTGTGQLIELRATDTDEALVRKRYQEFVAKTLGALECLRSAFPYHVIDGTGSIEQTRQNILRELGG
jgi:adenylate kinase